jgi:hypothetical protein
MKKIFLLSLIIMLSSIGNSQIIKLQEDFNSSSLPAGWTNTAVSGAQAWIFGLDGASGMSGMNNLDGTMMAYFDDENLGLSNINNVASLTSPVFDIANDSIPTLEFDYNFRDYAPAADTFKVEVFDGSAWNLVFFRTNDDCGRWTTGLCTQGFPHAKIDISNYKNANCQVRFTFHDGNDWSWYAAFDNVVVSVIPKYDIGITQLISKSSGCNLNAAEPIAVKIKNYGTRQTNSPITVTCNINQGAQLLIETISTPIAPLDSITYTFSGTVNLSSVGQYVIETYTNFTADTIVDNDSLITIIENIGIEPLPFFESFEGNLSFTIEGTNSSWSIGTPNNTLINRARLGQNAAVTNLSGNYNNNENSYLVLPCFDFSQDTTPIIVTFDLFYRTEAFFDKLIFESSIDNGLTWQTVAKGNNSKNWYAGATFWDGLSEGWLRVENEIPHFAGLNPVKFRFNFESDGVGVNEGVGIDNFLMHQVKQKDIQLSEILYPKNPTQNNCGFATEFITVAIKNIGLTAIDTLYLSYQVNNGAIFTDTILTPIASGTDLNHVFNTSYNFSNIGAYSLSAWLSSPGDLITKNDSILNDSLFVVANSSGSIATLPFFEDFESFTSGTGVLNAGSSLANGWVTTPTGAGNFWGARNTPTGSANSGPFTDHSPTGNTFMFVENEAWNSSLGDIAILESSCIDLSAAKAPLLEFWYHRYGSNMSDLYIDIFDGARWINGVDSVLDQPQTSSFTPYSFKRISLQNVVGRKIKIRFRTSGRTGSYGDMAIDDVLVYNAPPKDAELLEILNTDLGFTSCNGNIDGPLTVSINNLGSTMIQPNDLILKYQIESAPIVIDTVKRAIRIGDTISFTFSTLPIIPPVGSKYSIKTWGELNGDTISENDSITVPTLYNYPTYGLPYYNNFNDFVPLYTLNESISYDWHRNSDPKFLDYAIGAQLYDNRFNRFTENDLDEKRIGLRSNSIGSLGDVATIEGPCINLGSAINPVLVVKASTIVNSFSGLTTLVYVDINDGTNWINNFDSLQVVNSQLNPRPFIFDTIPLSPFAGNVISVRFRSKYSTYSSTNYVIDNMHIFEPLNKDLWVRAITAPASGCNLSNSEQTTISIKNVGKTTILPGTMTASIQLGSQTLNEIIPFSIPTNSSISYTFSQSIDLSLIDSTYNINVSVNLQGDTNLVNNSITKEISNTTKKLIYSQGFESYNDITCSTFNLDNLDLYNLPLGWEVSDTTDTRSWQIINSSLCSYLNNSSTPSRTTGPDSAHTGNSFIFLEGSYYVYGRLITPCIDLNGFTNVNADFWYHKYGMNMADLIIDIDTSNNGSWFAIDSILGQTHFSGSDPWLLKSISLDAFVNHVVKLRFRPIDSFGTPFTTDMAIDDFKIYDPTITRINNEAQKSDDKVLVYPNPNRGSFNLKVPLDLVGKQFYVYDMKGSLIFQARLENQLSRIDLSGLSKGICFIQIENNSKVHKVVIQ